jgi:2-polyprenyl-6-methoxyphenol hydroxylase-like FAD-dependent oxidoreductase
MWCRCRRCLARRPERGFALKLSNRFRVAVVGGSLGGLSAANVLHRLGADVQVFEVDAKRFQQRGGALGPVDGGLVHAIRPDADAETRLDGHGHFYGALWAHLYAGLPAGTVRFGVDVQALDAVQSTAPRLKISNHAPSFDLIIGADGGRSVVRPYVSQGSPAYAGYTVWRGLVPMGDAVGPPSGSTSLAGVRYDTLGFPLVGAGGVSFWNCGVYMAMPESEVERPSRNRQLGQAAMRQVPDWFLPFIEMLFDQHSTRFWRACIAHGKVTPHAVWEFAAERVVHERVILLGDAAHMASPRTGAGAYTAMVDAIVLGKSLEQANTLEEALQLYNDSTVARGRQLYQRSRAAAAYFAPEGRPIASPEALLPLGRHARS